MCPFLAALIVTRASLLFCSFSLVFLLSASPYSLIFFVVWVEVVDKECAEIGDVDQVELAPEANVAKLRDAVILKMSKKLSHCDANDLRVFAARANPKEDTPLRRSIPAPDAPLIIVAPGKFLLFFLRVVLVVNSHVAHY